MSTHFGGRTLARSQALQLLFQAEANSRAVLDVLDGEYALSQGPLEDYARRLALGADERRPDLDAVIAERSTGWSLSRMNAVDRNLLRLSLYEMLYVDEVDLAVTIDECVELAKAYGHRRVLALCERHSRARDGRSGGRRRRGRGGTRRGARAVGAEARGGGGGRG